MRKKGWTCSFFFSLSKVLSKLFSYFSQRVEFMDPYKFVQIDFFVFFKKGKDFKMDSWCGHVQPIKP